MATAQASPKTTRPPVGGRSILVADKDEMTRTATVAILQRLGFEVVEADDSKSTLAQARSRSYSCVILDLNLAETNAFELCRRLIAKAGWSWTPVIFTSLRHAQLDMQLGMRSGGFAYLPKPFKADQLLAAVGDALASEGQMRQAQPNRKLLLDRAEAAIER